MSVHPRPGRFDLSGSVAAVIGATGTLGGAIAEGLAEHGASVAVLGRNQTRGDARVASICDRSRRGSDEGGGRACFVSVDASDRASLDAARDALETSLGPCDVLVNCAGGNDPRAAVTGSHPLEAMEIEAWRDNFAMNVEAGVLLPSQVFGPGMRDRGGGSIVNIASVAAHIPVSRGIAYSAAKAAVVSITRFLAREWAGSGVRVNSITPGFFLADQNRALLQHDDGTPTERAATILGHTPMNRFGEPDELIGAAVFLASHRASGFVTGSDVRVDGGFTAMTI